MVADLYRDLHTFRITWWRAIVIKKYLEEVLDYIIDEPNPNSNLQLAINSKIGIDSKLG